MVLVVVEAPYNSPRKAPYGFLETPRWGRPELAFGMAYAKPCKASHRSGRGLQHCKVDRYVATSVNININEYTYIHTYIYIHIHICT